MHPNMRQWRCIDRVPDNQDDDLGIPKLNGGQPTKGMKFNKYTQLNGPKFFTLKTLQSHHILSLHVCVIK